MPQRDTLTVLKSVTVPQEAGLKGDPASRTTKRTPALVGAWRLLNVGHDGLYDMSLGKVIVRDLCRKNKK